MFFANAKSQFNRINRFFQIVGCILLSLLLSDRLIADSSANQTQLAMQDQQQDSLVIPSNDPESLELAANDSLALDTLLTDSLNFLLVDSLLSTDSLDSAELINAIPIYTPPPPFDSLAPPRPAGTSRYSHDYFNWFPYQDGGELVSVLPGLFSRHRSLYGTPFYLIPSRISGRELLVTYRGRPFNDPVTGAMNFSIVAPEEIGIVDLSQYWSGQSSFSSGPVLAIIPYHEYTNRPMVQVVYRQGYFGLGNADWRLSHKLHDYFRYYFGVNIGEYEGRYVNSAASSTLIRMGGEFNLGTSGILGVYYNQSRLRYWNDRSTGKSHNRRHDLDLIWRLHAPSDTSFYEIGAWHTSSFRKYNEYGTRNGIRFRMDRLLDKHRLTLSADAEHLSATLNRFEHKADPKGKRTIVGVTLSDLYYSDFLRINGSVRTETGSIGTVESTPDSASNMLDAGLKYILRPGGSFTAEYGDTAGMTFIGTSSLGWRWPGLNESYGHWTITRHESDTDPVFPPTGWYRYEGTASLKPVGGLFAGIGGMYRFDSNRSVRIMAGYRRYIDPITQVVVSDSLWSNKNDDDLEGFEFDAEGWIHIYKPVSFAFSMTYCNIGDKNQPIPEYYGWTSLRYEQEFYNGQLRFRSALTGYLNGEYTYNEVLAGGSTLLHRQSDSFQLDYHIAARVLSFELFWGIRNQFSERYEYIPEYPSLYREEYWGVRWVLWD